MDKISKDQLVAELKDTGTNETIDKAVKNKAIKEAIEAIKAIDKTINETNEAIDKTIKESIKAIDKAIKEAIETIDKAVKEAKNQLMAETKKTKYENLESLFDSQIQTLKDRGCPEQIVELLTRQKSAVLSKASEMTFEDGHIPFIPVIPRSYRSLYDLIAMVINKNKQGHCYLSPTVITDLIKTPDDPYYIYNIENGEDLLGKSPENAEKILKEQSRSPLTVAEVMALATHTDVLKEHNVWILGSRYKVLGGVPYVFLDNDDQPRLTWGYIDESNSRSGTASCGLR